jgi:maltooligosyltrehalose synthase
MGDDATRPPVGPEVWGDTELLVPDASRPCWRNLLTDAVVETRYSGDRRTIPVSALFSDIPLALLVDEPEGEPTAGKDSPTVAEDLPVGLLKG